MPSEKKFCLESISIVHFYAIYLPGGVIVKNQFVCQYDISSLPQKIVGRFAQM